MLTIDSQSAQQLNQYTPEEQRRIPFRHMIYIGDGLTDVPCMKLVRANGGQSIAVYDPTRGKSAADTLQRAQRVTFVVPAAYGPESRLEKIVRAMLQKIRAEADLLAYQ